MIGGLAAPDCFTVRNTDLNNRAVITDLISEAEAGPLGKRIVNCGDNTKNTPYKEGLTTLQSGTAIICMSSANYGTILYITAGSEKIFFKSKSNAIWGDWKQSISNTDIQAGNASLSECAPGKTTDFDITFPNPFPTIPKIMVSLRSSSQSEKYGLLTPYVANASKTGFTFRVANAHTTSLAPLVSWMAML